MIVQAGLFAPKVAPPPPQDPFYNRVTELDYFKAKFSREVGFVTVLVGPRNCGKSRLLKELLRQKPVIVIDEANDLMDWKEPDPLQPELKQLLSFLVSISKEDRLAHVILATSDYFLANWLTQVGMTEDKFRVKGGTAKASLHQWARACSGETTIIFNNYTPEILKNVVF
ncbi:hypothetical protein Ndes2526A_g02326 [Nannochloris sp. 'desiccata']